MKQILLRVPDELHRRLTDRARHDGRSVNALASELLDIGAVPDGTSRRERLRARAMTAGVAASTGNPAALTAGSRAELLETTRGWGELADDLIDGGRNRL